MLHAVDDDEPDCQRSGVEIGKSSAVANSEDIKVRLRRTKSSARAEWITDVERKARLSQADKPCHSPKDSLLSWSSGFNEYEGLINWGGLILCLGGTRLFLENLIKYGIRINPLTWIMAFYSEAEPWSVFNTPLFLLGSNVHFLFVFYLEKQLAKDRLPAAVGCYLHVFHLLIVILLPFLAINLLPDTFGLLGRTTICSIYTVMFLKLWSYAQVNYWCRFERKRQRKTLRGRSMSFRADPDKELIDEISTGAAHLVEYPDNLTLKDLYYFLCAPTLCYELNFPRSQRIRKRFLLRRLFEVIIGTNILIGLFQQWIIPSVRNSFQAFSDMDFIRCAERLLKLSIPNHLLWLTWFYLFFHSFLNTVGELVQFADRNFYQDWWNSKDVGTFWRLWNLPVHKWAVRHLFVPVVKAKYSKTTAAFAVFSLSAFFHEYLVSVPLRMYKVFVFLGMLVQVPLVYISVQVASKFGERWGNVIVWASLILGQPLGIMVYYHDYVVKNFDPSLLSV